MPGWFDENAPNPDNPMGATWQGQPADDAPVYGSSPQVNTGILNPTGPLASPTGTNQNYVSPAQGAAGYIPPAVTAGGQGDAAAFIRHWQDTHPASANAPQELIAALRANGFNASPYMYGNTPSGNEINLNGEKYKVIGGENSGSPFWYHAGDDDSGGGGGGFPGLAGPTGNGLYNVPGGGPLNAFLPLPTGLDYTNDPGYQERLKLGTNAIQNSAAAKGSLLSGKTLADLTNYAQTFASNEYGNAFDRAMRSQDAVFNRNFSLADLGYRGSATLAGAIGQNAANQSGLTTDQGQASAERSAAEGSSMASSIADLAKLGLGYYYNSKFGKPAQPDYQNPFEYPSGSTVNTSTNPLGRTITPVRF